MAAAYFHFRFYAMRERHLLEADIASRNNCRFLQCVPIFIFRRQYLGASLIYVFMRVYYMLHARLIKR